MELSNPSLSSERFKREKSIEKIYITEKMKEEAEDDGKWCEKGERKACLVTVCSCNIKLIMINYLW